MKTKTLWLAALLTVFATLLAHSEGRRRVRNCSPDTPCTRRGRCGGDDNSCVKNLVCLANNRCGPAKSNKACTRRKTCDQSTQKKCQNHRECDSGHKCEKAQGMRYKTCIAQCPSNQVFTRSRYMMPLCGADLEQSRSISTSQSICGCAGPTASFDPLANECVNNCDRSLVKCQGELELVPCKNSEDPECMECGCREGMQVVPPVPPGSMTCQAIGCPKEWPICSAIADPDN